MARNINIRGQYLKMLANSREFQSIFSSDKILDALESERKNRKDDLLELTAILGGVFQLNSVILQPVTPGVLSVLWLLRSPFLALSDKITNIDIDICLYLMAKGRDAFSGDICALPVDAANFCVVNKIYYEEAKTAILDALRLSFKAYKMFPHNPEINNKRELQFDSDWLTKLVSMVHSVSGEKPDDIIWKMPMTSAGYYVVQYCRRNGVRNIEPRPDYETVKLIWKRTDELCREYLEKMGITKEDYELKGCS